MQAILIVDDDCETRDAVAGLLGDEGYVVRVASNGADALLQLRAGDVGLVLTDLVMPKMNGWTLLETMAADHDLASIPVVIVTALPRNRIPRSIPVLRKPFALEALLDMVETLLSSPRSASRLCAAPPLASTVADYSARTQLMHYTTTLAKCSTAREPTDAAASANAWARRWLATRGL